MNRLLITLAIVSLLSLNGGCNTAKQPDLSRAPEWFYSQQRTGELFHASGIEEFTMRGSNMTVAISSQLPPLSMWPANPTVQEAIVREIGTTARMGFGAWAGTKIVGSLSRRPTVVEPAIVRPEIVEIPQAATVTP